MIEITCRCGAALEAAENDANVAAQCGSCGAPVTYLCGESLPDGAGAGDFDLALTIVRGPDRVNEQFALGGVAEIDIGKSEGKLLRLTGGAKVSRAHAKFVRIDFGPSRWELQDNKSTNGVFVNGQRVENHTIVPGDKIVIGDYLLEARDATPVPVTVGEPEPAPAPTGKPKHPCPKCGAGLPSAKAVFCTSCGTDLRSGKRALLSKELDEDAIHIRAENTMMFISWIIPFGLFPIASEALGTKKPLTTWIITGVTALCSVAFMLAMNQGASEVVDEEEDFVVSAESGPSPGLQNLMLWSGDPEKEIAAIREATEITKEDEQRLKREIREDSKFRNATDAQINKQFETEKADALAKIERMIERSREIGFRPYQLVTHAFLHDFSGWIGMILHFGGNLLFLLVFGMRVNELIGQWRFAVSYVLLAIGAGLSHHIMEAKEFPMPMVGASGAIMGLAGMYFVLFPLQKVFMAIWIRLGLFTGFKRYSKVFKMPGVWLLVLWILWNDILPIAFWKALGLSGSTGGVAHWAHVGGFVTGVVLAIIWLLTRQVHAHGADLISRMLGPSAAKFIKQN